MIYFDMNYTKSKNEQVSPSVMLIYNWSEEEQI